MRKPLGIGLAAVMAVGTAFVGGAVFATGASADPCSAVANRHGYTGSATQPQIFRVLEYNYVEGIGTLRNEDYNGDGVTNRVEHLEYAKASKIVCNAVNIGAIGVRDNPLAPGTKEPAGALVVFRGDVTDAAIDEYATNDPYALAGLIDLSTNRGNWTVVG